MKGGFPMTQILVAIAGGLSVAIIIFGFLAYALIMEPVWLVLIGVGFLLLLMTAYADWYEKVNRY